MSFRRNVMTEKSSNGDEISPFGRNDTFTN